MSAEKLTPIKLLRRPIHRFLRNPNIAANTEFRTWSRNSCFDNTLKVLEDPANGRKLYLIGTTHASTTLANRTKKLIKEINPDAVVVQTSEEWAERASHVDVTTQRQMTAMNKHFHDLVYPTFKTLGPRGLLFQLRYWSWLYTVNFYMGFPSNFHPLQPGLEMKYAVETAKETGADVQFLGNAFNQGKLNDLEVEKRLNFITTAYNSVFKDTIATYNAEHNRQTDVLATEGSEAYAESIDDYTVGWWVNFLDRTAPNQKRILVDKADREIGTKLINTEGEKIVAVVNHWHLPGVEHTWRTNTNTHQEDPVTINPVGDMDINQLMEDDLQAHLFNHQLSRLTGTEPATSENVIVQFTDTTHEHERNRHVFFLGHDDPEMAHGLWNGENDDVEYYEHKGHGHH